ncbi:MAG: sulfite exporter TauE/SafE family protein, partial [Gaiellaceae bacterium]
MTWQLSLAGLLIGGLVGMTGMGGGSLMTPLLILIFGFKPTVAVGTDILHGAIFKSFGAVRHRQLGTVNARLAGWMLVGSAPLSLLGVALGSWIERHYGKGAQAIETKILGAALVIGGLGFLLKTFLRGRDNTMLAFPVLRRDVGTAIAIGATGGFVVGLTSVGSGTFFGLMMLLLFPLSASRMVGTDIFHAAALLWVAGIG